MVANESCLRLFVLLEKGQLRKLFVNLAYVLFLLSNASYETKVDRIKHCFPKEYLSVDGMSFTVVYK